MASRRDGASATLAPTAEPGPLRATNRIEHGGFWVGSLSDLSNPVYPPDLPDHVVLYLAVDDVRVRTSLATESGATCVLDPFELPDVGRMAFIVDPWGAGVALWESRGFDGWNYPAEPNHRPVAPAHTSTDPDAAREFYQGLGLLDGGADFQHDQHQSEWRVRVAGLQQAVQTPGGVVLHTPAG